MRGEGEEEDGSLFTGGDGWFPELFQGSKKSNGELESIEVGAQGHEIIVTEIAMEVGSEAVPSANVVGDALGRHNLVYSKT